MIFQRALVIYMTYSNLLSITQASIAQSRVSFTVGLSMHLLMLTILVALFYRRLTVVSLRRLFSR